jgi:hypothetical protein
MFDLDQPKVTVRRKITYPLFWRQGVRISTNSPETKTEFVDVVALSAQKNVEAVLCIRWLHYTSSPTDHPNVP